MLAKHPYADLEDRAFWRKAVAAEHATMLKALFDGMPDITNMKIATAGSCFAQHIGRALRNRGLKYMDYEPAPTFLNAAQADRLGYGVYSCRYGNIYTVRQLRQLFDEAFGLRTPIDGYWTKDGRVFDALRPGVEPGGFGSLDEARSLRIAHLRNVQSLLRSVDLFIFTLGLTECWVSTQDETAYPIAPGVQAGQFVPERYQFRNFRYPEIQQDMVGFIEAVRHINPEARFLLTVSPVPLAATASGNHVLVATTYSKSVLRSVAGDLAADIPGVFYFPSYEIITGQPARHMYYNPDLRTVCKAGVTEVMRHFFEGTPSVASTPIQSNTPAVAQADVEGFEHCDEILLDGGAR